MENELKTRFDKVEKDIKYLAENTDRILSILLALQTGDLKPGDFQ